MLPLVKPATASLCFEVDVFGMNCSKWESLSKINETSRFSFAVYEDPLPYTWGTMFGRYYHDLWAVDLSSGERTRVVEKVRYSWSSPDGQYLLWFDGTDYISYRLADGRLRNLTEGLDTEFAFEGVQGRGLDGTLLGRGEGRGGGKKGGKDGELHDDHFCGKIVCSI